MRSRYLLTQVVLALVALAGLNGCGGSESSEHRETASSAPAAHGHESGHDHEAPHGGHVVDLGSGKYHAELTHDDATHNVGVYILDGTAKNTMPIDAPSVTINCIAGGQPAQFVLPAAPQVNDPPGTASHFGLASEALCDAWDAPHAAARLNVLIDGRPYVGNIEAHDHTAGHGHSHAGDDALVWRQEVSEQGYRFALGHHGKTLRAGHEVEPAVQITREGLPVAKAEVFNSLLAADGSTVLAAEVATVYEPPSADEPAHYAQGALRLPAGAERVAIRFRIVLPEGRGERTFDVPVDVK